jgi:hypothetical protein
VNILGEGEERNFPLGEILPKAKFLCSPLTFTSKLTLTTHSPVADTLRHPPMTKVTFRKASFLKTGQVVALTGIKSKRKVGR